VILVGTSGFSYPDWKGKFYPEGLPQSRWLHHYASHFSALEVNFTYYRLPGPRQLAAMAEKGGGLVLTVKANRDMTHSGKATEEDYASFRRALEPPAQDGRLGCVLAQFPWAFRPSAGSRGVISSLRRRLAPFPLVVEFRHAYWAAEATFAFLREEGVGFCAVDEPRLRGLFPPLAEVTSPTAYVRFHGRNAGAWWGSEAAHERYDYLYTKSQLREWVPRIGEMEQRAETVFVFTNNHYEGKAAVNAMMLQELLGLPAAGGSRPTPRE